ncbi:hypothetical protein G6F65_021252 [Rhizopus arrhizus]|nr:hypothetical protein G6F65_021252 [Rhizopus arrhizus]
MPSDEFPVVLADRRLRRHVRILIRDVPRHPDNVLGLRTTFGQDGDNVRQRLADLVRQVIRFELLLAIPPHLPAHAHELAAHRHFESS